MFVKISVKHILLECPITTELFQKNGYDLNAYNNVRDILYNTDVITNIVRSIDPFHLHFHACAMDWHVKSAGSRGNTSAGLLAERIAVFP